ncbi:MAG: glycerol-3-phosphate 1-O-acyltransferase PlsY [Planctomycetes bacterium]|nr:glycerol-3-phosphate 1-O-acyltransferase PlsY [Planctomycetota bacterium]
MIFLCLAASYLLGAIPFALLLGKLKGLDLRAVGSGNIGATNLTRTAGKPWGYTAFLLDFLKGLLPVLAARWLLSSSGASPAIPPLHAQVLSGLAAVLGHIFPVYLRFRGGKGVATSFGVISGLLWMAALCAAAAWLGIYLASRIVSIASIAAAVCFPLATLLLYWSRPREELIPLAILSSCISALILIRHRSNIQRLLTGKEHKF